MIRAIGRLAPRFAPGLSMMLLYLAFLPEEAKGVDVVYEFDLEGPGGGVFSVVVKDGDCKVSIGSVTGTPDVRYEMDASTWLAMTQGKVTGDEAVLLGRLRIKGDVVLGRRFNDLFAPVGEAAVKLAAEAQGGSLLGESARAGVIDRVLRRKPAA